MFFSFRTVLSVSVILIISLQVNGQSGLSIGNDQAENDSLMKTIPQSSISLLSDSVQTGSTVGNKAGEKSKKEITPKRIALLSLAAPGIGQIYNKRYWKLPIVYGLIGTGAFFIGRNAKELKTFNTALDMRFDTNQTDIFEGIYTTDQLYAFRSYYQRNVEISAILTGLAWTLQIVDAVVDAHLKKFDISDDLSIRVKPSLLMVKNNIAPGISLQLSFR